MGKLEAQPGETLLTVLPPVWSKWRGARRSRGARQEGQDWRATVLAVGIFEGACAPPPPAGTPPPPALPPRTPHVVRRRHTHLPAGDRQGGDKQQGCGLHKHGCERAGDLRARPPELCAVQDRRRSAQLRRNGLAGAPNTLWAEGGKRARRGVHAAGGHGTAPSRRRKRRPAGLAAWGRGHGIGPNCCRHCLQSSLRQHTGRSGSCGNVPCTCGLAADQPSHSAPA